MTKRRLLHITPLALLLAAAFVDLIGYGIVVPLLPLYVQRLGGGATLVGLLGALYALVQAVCGPMLGALSDRYGRRPMLLVCLFGTAAGYVLLGLADTLWMLAAAMLLDAATGGNISIAQAYIADQATPETRARDLGLLGVAFGLGVTAGPVLAGLLSGFAPGAPALAAAGLTLANLTLVALALPESLPAEQRVREIRVVINPLTHLRIARMSGATGIGRMLLAILLINLAFAGLQSNFPVFSRTRFGWDAATTAYFFAFVGFCAVLSQGVLLGPLRARYGERLLSNTGAALMAAGLPLLGLTPQSWLLYPLAAIVAFGSSMCIPSLTSMLADRAGAAIGRMMGAQQVAINLALVTGPLIAGLSFDQIGSWAPYALGGLCALTALGVLIRR